MSQALSLAAYVDATYRIARTEAVRTVIDIGRCAPGDQVVNYRAGDDDANLAIAERVAAGGVLYAVDSDPQPLGRLMAAAHKRGLSDIVRPWEHDAMLAAGIPHVPTHILCLFGLHKLADSALATRRWAMAASPATKMLTADWAAVWDPVVRKRPAEKLPPVSPRWSLVQTVTLEFQLPASTPPARRVLGDAYEGTAMASLAVREWTRRDEPA